MTQTELKENHKDSHLDLDAQASGDRLNELKAGRHVDDIPLTDEFWIALRYHNQAVTSGKMK